MERMTMSRKDTYFPIPRQAKTYQTKGRKPNKRSNKNRILARSKNYEIFSVSSSLSEVLVAVKNFILWGSLVRALEGFTVSFIYLFIY